MSRRAQVSLTVGASIVVLALMAWTAGLLPRPGQASPQYGMLLDPPKPATDFALTASGERQVRLSDFRGKVVALYFGYTYCPDVCPMTLAMLKDARARLGEDASDVQVIMISVDPERDTPEHLEDYVGRFDPSFLGVTGTDAEIAAVAESFGVHYARREVPGSTGYLVDHTAAVLVIDREGRLRSLLPNNLTGEQAASDLRQLVRE